MGTGILPNPKQPLAPRQVGVAVDGILGYPSARNFRFTNVRLHDVRSVVKSTLAPEKPLEGLWLENVSGTAQRGIELEHVRGAVLRNVTFSGFSGPRLAVNDVTGEGLEGPGQLEDAGKLKR